MLALGLFAAIVTVLAMQVNDFIAANDTPSVSTAGVSEAVTHVQSYICESNIGTDRRGRKKCVPGVGESLLDVH